MNDSTVRNLRTTNIPAAAALQAHICQNIPAFQSSQFESLLRCFPAGQLAAELDGRRPRIDCGRMKVGAGGTAP
ncbi:MAG: hypothetical protein OHM77_02890 [Candidatus Nitricoxidivorans perseverans]|uniref:Uncharacterized protein n=1 Tax=Candidatus Nitricoxidivorans perseverans TaxID=2975601 RepID=A0AA49IXQ9_9PROT|nr:MAG: hypothetical protein OHM77_02890 [Candidatus Nitricoxidivorans perseverans]